MKSIDRSASLARSDSLTQIGLSRTDRTLSHRSDSLGLLHQWWEVQESPICAREADLAREAKYRLASLAPPMWSVRERLICLLAERDHMRKWERPTATMWSVRERLICLLAERDHMRKWERPTARESDLCERGQFLLKIGLSHWNTGSWLDKTDLWESPKCERGRFSTISMKI